ncbi:MAG TPA: ABC transporter substrate-binding protein [Xanthobacteraceae bacterium]|nr:ABC transporter substrate-binding protein [Xanthobacteraceae bacterium]
MLKRAGLISAVVALAFVALAGTGRVNADPLKIRIGYGVAAEEQLWLLIAKPDIGTHYGKDYVIDGTRFSGSDKRAQAFEAGAIDIASSSANGVIFAAAQGVSGKIIASISRESQRGYSTSFYALASSPIKTVADLKGKTIAVNGFETSGHLWLKTELAKAGIAESDVTIVPIPFPAMAESLRSGKIDLGEFPQPFDALLHNEMQVTKIFTAKDAIPTDEELIVLVAKDDFLKTNTAAIKAFLDDLHAATKFYLDHPQEARQTLIDTKMVRVPADVFLGMSDYYRDPAMRAEVKILEAMQESQFNAGFQSKKADIDQLVDLSYLPN